MAATRVVILDPDRILLILTLIDTTWLTRSHRCLHRRVALLSARIVPCLLTTRQNPYDASFPVLITLRLDQHSTDQRPSKVLLHSTGMYLLSPLHACRACRVIHSPIARTVCNSVLSVEEPTINFSETHQTIRRLTAIAVLIGPMARDRFRPPPLMVAFPRGQPAQPR